LVSLSGAAGAVSLALPGRIANPDAVKSYFGTLDGVVLWLSNMRDGKVVGRAVIDPHDGSFHLPLPITPPTPHRPYEVCPGPSVKPARILTYTPETMMLYNRRTDKAIGPVMQADNPRNPTRIVNYVYSATPASVRGRCDSMNIEYHLKLRRGWNAVETSSVSTPRGMTVLVRNATTRLPFWVTGDLKFTQVRQVLPASFFQAL